MKSFLIQMGSQILRDAFSPSDGRGGLITALLSGPKREKPQPTIEPDFAYLNQSAILALRRILMGAVCGLFLILGSLATVFAATQSYDDNGQFVLTSSFIAAALITIFSAIGVLVARSQVLKVSFSWTTFLRGASQFPVSGSFADSMMDKEIDAEEVDLEQSPPASASHSKGDVEVLASKANQSERLAS